MKNIEDKEKAQQEFMKMTEKSWTWEKMTEEERKRFETAVERAVLIGTFTQRWRHLNDMYFAFLMGVGYTDFNWREEE